MSMQSVSSGGGFGADYSAIRERRRPPDMSQDQLTQFRDKLKSEGKDTSNLDKIISNFDALDTDGSGKVSADEVKAGAEQFGIEPPPGPPRGAHGMFGGGPPPGFFEQNGDTSALKTLTPDEAQQNSQDAMSKLIENFLKSDANEDSSSLLDVAA